MPEWEEYVRRRLRLPDMYPERELRIVRELAAGLEDVYNEGVAQGMSEAEASNYATQQIPDWNDFSREIRRADVANVRPRIDLWQESLESTRSGRGGPRMFVDVRKDVLYSLRRLWSNPGFTIVTVAILALGIGANSAMFSVVDAFLLRPLPFLRPHELVRVFEDTDEGTPGTNSYPAYLDLAAQTGTFARAAGIVTGWTATWLPDTGDPREVAVSFVTSSYFPVTGLRPFLGRAFETSEDRGGAQASAILGYRMWRDDFGADPGVIGRVIKLSGAPVTIIGIGPRGYGGIFSGHNVDLWLSLSSLGPIGGPYVGSTLERRGDHWFHILARLQPGVTPVQAQASANVLQARLARDYPDYHKGRKLTVLRASDVRLEPDIDRSLFPAGAVLMCVSALVLLVACSNLANLLLARGWSRGHELAVRIALGSTRWRLVRYLLIENVMLAIGGGILGLLIAEWSTRVLMAQKAVLPVPINLSLAVDFRVLAFTLGLALATGIMSGLLPAMRVTRPDLVAGLKDPESSVVARRSRGLRGLHLRDLFIVAQVASSLVLLAGAGLLIRSLYLAQNVDLGFDAGRNMAIIQADAGEAGYDGARAAAFFREFSERVQRLPGVEAVSQATRLPLTRGPSSTLVIDEYRARTGAETVEVEWAAVASNYFETLRLPILYGRVFTEADVAGTNPIVVVSESMARRYWGKADVVGQRYRHQGSRDSWVQIIGVVGDVKVESVGETAVPMFYRPLRPGASRLYTVARTSGDPPATVAMMRQELQRFDSTVPIFEAGTMASHVSLSLGMQRAAAGTVGIFGLVALLLAGIGMYGVVTFGVTRRTAEVGIRLALGARSEQVVGMLVREMMVLVIVGAGLGLGLALLLAPVLRSFLFGVAPADPLTFSVVTGLLMAVALFASWLPARQAAQIGPLAALRYRQGG